MDYGKIITTNKSLVASHGFTIAPVREGVIMMKRRIFIKVIILTVFPTCLIGFYATTAKWIANIILDYKYQYIPRHPCNSMSDSANSGLLVSEVTMTPNVVSINGISLQIREAWIEEEVEREHYLIWFTRHKKSGNYHFCLRFQKECTLFLGTPKPELLLGNDGIVCYTSYFGSIYNVPGDDRLFYITINTNVLANETVIICLPDPILCDPNSVPLASFIATSVTQSIPKKLQ